MAELRRFEADYAVEGGVPVARVQLDCTLSSRREHRQLATFVVEAAVDAGANRLGNVVAALEQAAQQATAQLVTRSGANRLYETCNQ